MGYPIAAVDHLGQAVITMEKGKHGLVTPATIASQLLYEIQGYVGFLWCLAYGTNWLLARYISTQM
jgi:hypothetical protein